MSNAPDSVGVAAQNAAQPPLAPSNTYQPGMTLGQQGGVASLYVGELKPDVNEQVLWNIFSPHGQVLSIKVCRDSQTQFSLGYAYVNFRSHQEAEKAMEIVNFTLIDGKPCRVMWSMRDSSRRRFGVGNLFIKNIDPNLDAKSLYQAFSAFGPVLSCKIALDEYGISKGYGFIQFFNEKDAEKARERSNGVRFSKKRLFVTKFIAKNERKDAKTVNPEEYTNIFVKNFGKEWTDVMLRKKFEKYGEITSAVIQKNDKGESLGYGFVNFAKHEYAKRAVAEMDDQLDNGNKITVCRAMKKLERQAYLKRQYEERKREIFKKYQSMNLYVKNFDESVTDEKLKAMFVEFGEIKSAHVMKDENNRSRCFGFVCFSKPEEAEEALKAMNLKVSEGKPLYVSHAQSKEDRRKLFEQQTYNNSFRGPMIPPQAMQFVYPPPGSFPYPPQPQFTRYPQAGGRIQGRGMQQGPMPPGQQYINQGMRPQYFNQQSGYNMQNNYRTRGGSMGSRGQSGGYVQRHHQVANQPPAVGVNNVVTENQTSNKHKEAKQQQKSVQDPKNDFKNRIYLVCQNFFIQKNFDSSQLGRVSGMVIEYFSNDSSAHMLTNDNEIKDAALSAYQNVCQEETVKK